MKEIIIEIYSDKYKDSMARLILGIQQEEFGIPITLEQQPDLEAIAPFYQVKKGNFWIAKMDHTIIGSIALLDMGNDQAALRKMFVAKDHRGKDAGIAQALLNVLIGWARQKGFREIFLGTTEQFKAAQRFYEKNGFAAIPKQALPASFPVMEVDTRFYQYSL